MLRVGRSYGINVVLATDMKPAPTVSVDVEPKEFGRQLVRAYSRGEIEEMCTAVIFALGGGRATLRTPGTWPALGVYVSPADNLSDFMIPEQER